MSGEKYTVVEEGNGAGKAKLCVYIFRDRPVLIVHGDKREAKARLIQQAQPFPHVRFCQVQAGPHRKQLFIKGKWLILFPLWIAV